MLSSKKMPLPGRKVFIGLLLCSVLALQAGVAHALAPEHEIRRLMLATEEAVNAENWSEATDYLNRLQAMEGEKPADYFYYRGRAMLQANRLGEARSALETYVGRAGADGSHYQQSLKLITNIEKSSRAHAQALAKSSTSEQNPVAMIEPAGDQDPGSLRRLYLADSDQQALVIHLNTLLESAGWRRDNTLVRLDRPADIRYQVAVSGANISIQEINRNTNGTMVRKTVSLTVFGVNPQLRWDCEPMAGACWVYDPRDGSRLFKLAANRDQAQEIARTLGRLIRDLQQSD